MGNSIEQNKSLPEAKENQADTITKLVDDLIGKSDTIEQQQPAWQPELRAQLDEVFGKDDLQIAAKNAVEAQEEATQDQFTSLQQTILKDIPEARNVGNA